MMIATALFPILNGRSALGLFFISAKTTKNRTNLVAQNDEHDVLAKHDERIDAILQIDELGEIKEHQANDEH